MIRSQGTPLPFDPASLRDPFMITRGIAGSNARHRMPISGMAGSASSEGRKHRGDVIQRLRRLDYSSSRCR